MHKIFIVIPTRNSYQILQNLVFSLEMQTSFNWRVLFIDGNSIEEHKKFLTNLCHKNKKFEWQPQERQYQGIYGAMNQGFKQVKKGEWILFWGSDDWCFSKKTIANIINEVKTLSIINKIPDILIFRGNYLNLFNKKFIKKSLFITNKKNILINVAEFKNLVFKGLIPPHQSTLFSKDLIQKIGYFDQEYELAADLNYFLKICNLKKANIFISKEVIVNIGYGGVSNRKNLKRTTEVIKSYRKFFKFFWIIPFLLRYIRRMINLLNL